jgi:hypothetical protein
VSAKDRAPALSDAKSIGGVIAQDGFDYQLWDGMARLPAWLANPAFEELIFEGLEDLEARFFAPQAPRQRLLERYQAKSGNLNPKDVREIFETFHAFETAYPNLARTHTLVTRRLPATLGWLARDPLRVRKARPFYAPFADVSKASDEKLRADLGKEYGSALGGFVADAVEIAERVLPDRDSALQAFAVALTRAFAHINASQKKIEQAFEALSGLARKSLGVPLKRDALVGQIGSALGEALFTNPALPIHVRSDRNEVNEAALEIDASAFSGGSSPFPAPGRWRDELIAPLDCTARWLRSRNVTRLAIGGSYRLTTAFALGQSFRAATGFELDIQTRGGNWSTDDRPRSDEAYPAWAIRNAQILAGDRLIVTIGILRDPEIDLLASGMSQPAILNALLTAPVASGHAAQSGIALVKSAVSAAAARLKPAAIELYFAGPAAFALALGHRWNAMPPTQLHEFIAPERRYVATAIL